MTEYDVSSMKGIHKFQTDHEAELLGELATLDVTMHENCDKVTIEQVERHKLLQKLHDQTCDIINGLIEKAKG